jgi:hypothetical protein
VTHASPVRDTGVNEDRRRFPISFTPARGVLLRTLLIPQRLAYVDVGPDIVRVSMSWAFQGRFLRDDIESVERRPAVKVTTGVHGWRGSWLVNGSSFPIIAIKLRDPVRAWVIGLPITLREVRVSVDNADEFIAALR